MSTTLNSGAWVAPEDGDEEGDPIYGNGGIDDGSARGSAAEAEQRDWASMPVPYPW